MSLLISSVDCGHCKWLLKITTRNVGKCNRHPVKKNVRDRDYCVAFEEMPTDDEQE